ncbi:ribosomal RNA small subunit methyltransferase E [candidate division SR1 bacterium]|nr:ribosomal RNA small subunit methyltransferase E [candidate division SR1 bacterium]
MQLFIIPNFKREKNQIFVPDCQETVFQMRKVLRMRIGGTFYLQSVQADERYEVQIDSWTDKSLSGTILTSDTNPEISAHTASSQLSMLIAMPNKREKAELIVQKLSEIGVDYIYFRPASRSVITQRNERKAQRLHKISREAVEQSRGWKLPVIERVSSLDNILKDKNVIVFDKTETSVPSFIDGQKGLFSSAGSLIGIIGPEGGLNKIDYGKLSSPHIVSLGNTVLRMETAAIVGARRLKYH